MKNRNGKTGLLSEETLPNEALRTAIAFALTRGPVEDAEERTL